MITVLSKLVFSFQTQFSHVSRCWVLMKVAWDKDEMKRSWWGHWKEKKKSDMGSKKKYHSFYLCISAFLCLEIWSGIFFWVDEGKILLFHKFWPMPNEGGQFHLLWNLSSLFVLCQLLIDWPFKYLLFSCDHFLVLTMRVLMFDSLLSVSELVTRFSTCQKTAITLLI